MRDSSVVLFYPLIINIPLRFNLMHICSFQERFCYTSPDIAKEFNKYDSDPAKWIKQYEGVNSISKKVNILLDKMICNSHYYNFCSIVFSFRHFGICLYNNSIS